MGFFNDVKDKLETALEDIASLEHAVVLEESNAVLLYRVQEIEGDSMVHLNAQQNITAQQLEFFNTIFLASSEARTGISQFIIECIKQN